MEIRDYQDSLYVLAAKYPEVKESVKLALYGLGLAEEAGEVAGIIKRHYRGDYDLNDFSSSLQKQKLITELGDVLAYLTLICRCFSIDLTEVALTNLDKLQSRIERNSLLGRGSER